MSKIESVRQDFLSIPAPRFTLGDPVQYSLNYDDSHLTYFGIVQGICWSKETLEDPGSWEYIICVEQVLHNGSFKKRHNYDSVIEADLIPWNIPK